MQPRVVQLLQSPVLFLVLLVSAAVAAAQPVDYAPAPQPEQETGGPTPAGGPPFLGGPPAPPSHAAPSPSSSLAPAPAAASDLSPVEAPGPNTQSPGPGSAPAYEVADVKWCSVREEFEDCLTYTNLLNTPKLSWTCVLKESKGDCMEAIQQGDANLMSLDAGLAYVAFLNHSMKAILAEEYTFHAQYYAAVALVNKEMCDDNPNLKLEDFKSLKSCHSEYLSAAGWNYPVQTLLNSVVVDDKVLNESLPNDVKVLTSFFSASCAPSELGEGGICTACGNGDNSSFCSSTNNQYTGEAGAFRCLMEGRGDVAFLRAKTPTLYSSDGLNNQTWSTKSVDEFMYLCPMGGCKPVNDNHASCQFADVPANVVMTRNSLPESLRQDIVTTLLSANWTEALYTGRNWQNHLLSVRFPVEIQEQSLTGEIDSTQGLGQVNQLTRQYLGASAMVAQTIMDLESDQIHLSTSHAVQSSVPAYTLTIVLGALMMGVLGVFGDLW